jgi:hypothetical protein
MNFRANLFEYPIFFKIPERKGCLDNHIGRQTKPEPISLKKQQRKGLTATREQATRNQQSNQHCRQIIDKKLIQISSGKLWVNKQIGNQNQDKINEQNL